MWWLQLVQTRMPARPHARRFTSADQRGGAGVHGLLGRGAGPRVGGVLAGARSGGGELFADAGGRAADAHLCRFPGRPVRGAGQRVSLRGGAEDGGTAWGARG